ncbi:MAG TPA: 4Fe-4S dicluster domain-containing protein [bacterium]|nr:4Fe-4S dicluster domain-containing protein [bacterium]
MNLTRREFMSLAAAGGLGVTVVGAGVRPAQAVQRNGMAILIDVSRCVGCRSCEAACKANRGFPEGAAEDLSPTAYTYIHTAALSTPRPHPVLGEDGAGQRTVKMQCMHCTEPACASACPVAALRKTAAGPVVYDADRCMGCRYCLLACPFQIPRFEWRKALPVVTKCDMCAARQAEGKGPVCVEACPADALAFGPREKMLAEASRRIAAENTRYIPAIYGAEEAGGTSILYVSDVPFEELGFRVVVREPLPAYTWKALGKLPGVVIGLGAVLTGIEVVIRRRTEMQEKERELR